LASYIERNEIYEPDPRWQFGLNLKHGDFSMESLPSPFKSPEGEARYTAAYEASLRLWPVPYQAMDVPGRFGCTHLVASGPQDAPVLVLLHGYFASLTMWSPNIADLSRHYRVYAVDVMGQPSRSIPGEPIRSRADFVEWLTTLLDVLKVDRAHLAGMSYGGWLTLNYAIGAPQRVDQIVLLSPAGSFLPLVKQFFLRTMPLMFLPRRFVVDSFMRWLTYKENLHDAHLRAIYDCLVDQMYLGARYFRMQAGVMPGVFSDDELRRLQAPTLLLIGQQEVIYDPAASLERARRLVPNFEGQLVPRASHDMSFSQAQFVDARILEFLKAS
jgi:pimeloyl-ACP methyl ester carboxylesterase